MTSALLRTYEEHYCVIDMHNLFVATTLRDEVLLLDGSSARLPDVLAAAETLGVRPAADRRLASYSGGEQALLCCAMLMTLLPTATPAILLVHVLGTLSQRNRDLVLSTFARTMPDTRLYTLDPTGPQPVNHA